MTNLDLFENALEEAQAKLGEEPEVKIDCDTVHPIVAEYMIEVMEKVAAAEENTNPGEPGINTVVGDLVRQAAACLTEEVFGLFDEILQDASDLAVDVLLDLESDEEDDGTGLPDGYDEDADIPIMMSMDALEIIVKTAIKIGYMVIPEVEKHFE